jgi:hypothetical protein
MKTRNIPLQYLHAGYLSHNRKECQCPARRGGAAGRQCKSAIIKVLSKRLADGRERTTAKANFAAVLFLCFSLISGADRSARRNCSMGLCISLFKLSKQDQENNGINQRPTHLEHY